MTEFIGFVLSVALVFALAWFLSWVFWAEGPRHEAVEECRKAHNVYQCEFIQEARPVTPAIGETR